MSNNGGHTKRLGNTQPLFTQAPPTGAASCASSKGEVLHDLRAALMIANKGQLRHRRGEALTHQALCLNLVTNAVIVWNTVYMAAVASKYGHFQRIVVFCSKTTGTPYSPPVPSLLPLAMAHGPMEHALCHRFLLFYVG